MLNLKHPTNTSLKDVLGGVFGGIVVAYFLLYGAEIVTLDHHLDFAMLGNLLWLGIGVVLFGCWEAWRASRTRS